jgi:predicted NBD/HSP70 family sugar kinase
VTVPTERANRVAEILATSKEGLTRADLARHLDVSTPTLQRALTELRAEGWLAGEFVDGRVGSRLSGPLRLTRRAGLIVAVDCGRRHMRAQLCDLHGTPLGKDVEPTTQINVEQLGSTQLRTVAELVVAALEFEPAEGDSPYGLAEVRAIGIGVPSPVDARGAVVGMFLPQWSGLPLPAIVAEHLANEARRRGEALHPDLRITVAKDADLGALIMWQELLELRHAQLDAERRTRRRRRGVARLGGAAGSEGDHDELDEAAVVRQDSVVFVKASTGIDAGLICEGQRVTGAHGLAGQLGHLLVPAAGEELLAGVGRRLRENVPADAGGELLAGVGKRPREDIPAVRCSRCGRSLCLESLASGDAILRQLRRLGGEHEQPPASVEELATQVGSHQVTPLQHEAIVASGTRIGLVLAEVARLADPTVIVIGGLLALAGDAFITPLRVAFADAATGGLDPELIAVDPARIKRIELEGAIVLARRNLSF